ncbi:MAG: hypothetical protein M3Q80_00735 [bacterium]|nr:hypothetical protein [bacterium]
MDKDNNKIPEDTNDPLRWKSLGFFSAQEYLLYIFKKSEKITAALYLVSGLLKDEEPMKWQLRDNGMELMSASFMASSNVPGDKNSVIQSIFTSALETISLLNVALISNMITQMNHSLLVREIDNIVGLLRDRLTENAENAGYVLSESFFKTPDLFSSGFRSEPKSETKGQTSSSKAQSSTEPLKHRELHGHANTHIKKTHRQELIIEVLRTQSNLTIKDFSKVIKDCSEKTIQRELIELVDKGIVKKEGERRWSRYSLK